MMKKRILSLFVVLAMVMGISANMFTASASDDTTVVRLDPSDASPFNGGSFQGWGTSLGWWGNRIGYDDTLAQKAADLFYDEETGLGLDIVRYNVGGGDKPGHNHVTRSDSKMPCFAVPELNEDNTPKKENGKFVYDYDWNADHNQVNVLTRIKAKNNNVHIEGYTNSPPWFMTNTLCSGGGTVHLDSNGDVTSIDENLDPENYDDFAEFIAEVTKHFKEIGLKFDSYSPMNEPNPASKYWGENSVKQEGNLVAQGEHQSGLINAISDAFDDNGIDTLVAGMDETSIDYSINSFNALTDTAKANLDRLDTHTYSGSKRAQLKQTAKDAGKTLWMSEVDHGKTAGTNAGNMGMALDLANLILNDMNGMQPAAWVMWDILDFHKDSSFYYEDSEGEKHYYEKDNALNQNDGLWGVGMVNHDTKEIELTQKYYGYGQFTRYIEPGMTIIASGGNNLAAYDKKTGKIVIVGVNFSNTDEPITYDLRAFTKTGTKATPIRTSGAFDGGEHWAQLSDINVTNKQFTTSLKANSITTYVIEPEEAAPVDYMTISGATTVVVGVNYDYTAALGSSSSAPTVTWSVSDSEAADVNADTGVVKAKKGGSFTLTATMADGSNTSIDIKALDTNQTVRIVNKNSGKGLETKGQGVTSGTVLVQWSDRKLDTGAWKLSATDDGHFNIINANNNMLLANASDTLVISDSITDDNAKWDFNNIGGYYQIYNVGNKKSLDVSGQSTADGGSVILYNFSGGNNQLWSFSEITESLTHVEAVEIDYSEKYQGTDYDFVSNVESATNDFNAGEAKGFVFSGFAGLGTDSGGESVMLPQNAISNSSNTQRSGRAALTLSTPITCSDDKLINVSFDMVMAESTGESIFTMSSSDETELIKIVGTDYGKTYSLTIGKKEVESEGNGLVYFRNNQTGNTPNIKNGGHVEIYYRPSDGYIEVTIKNVTGSAEIKKYVGSVGAGKNIGKLYFAGSYTAWNKIMAVDNLETNIIKYAEGVEPPVNNIAPTVQAYRSGNIIGYTSDYSNDEFNMYIAVHDAQKRLVGISAEANGTITLPEANGTYTVTEYVWNGMEPVTEPIPITPEAVEDGYLFTHFVGSEANATDEQLYFTVSTDADNWITLNGGKPVLTSTESQKGIRDPFIIRGKDGEYVIIATDLSIVNGGLNWTTSQRSGSRNIVVWKSTDLVNWTYSLHEVMTEDSGAGCVWAPEAFYDKNKDKYMVFWASMVDGKQIVYRTYTEDFETFEPAEKYIEKDHSMIDTTIIENDGHYYRFTKDETDKYIFMETCDTLDGTWTEVSTFNQNGKDGYEGPTIFKLNGEDKWCLMLDKHNNGGYIPFTTTDLSTGVFTKASNVTFNTSYEYRHGTVLPITGEEYIRLIANYGI